MRTGTPSSLLSMVGRTCTLLPGGVGQSLQRAVGKNIFRGGRNFASSSSQSARISPSSTRLNSFSRGNSFFLASADEIRTSGERTFVSSALRSAKTHYETLELTESASPKEIKAAFYRLSKKYHPDLNPGDRRAEEMFKAVSAAYNILGDATKKREYDRDQAESSRVSYSSSSGRARRDSGGSESADWRYMDHDQMMREQEEVWRKLKEHEEKFGRGQANDFGFGHFKRTARPGNRTQSEQGPKSERERLYEEYMQNRYRKYGYDRRRTGLVNWRNLTIGQMMIISFAIGLALNLLINLFAPRDPYSPYQGRGPPR